MRFTDILQTFITTNNLASYIQEEDIFPDMLEEARKLKSELYKDLAFAKEITISPDNLTNIPVYMVGKNIKKGKTEEEVKKISQQQSEIYNKILQKLKEDSLNNKTTSGKAAVIAAEIFEKNKFNKTSAVYNTRCFLNYVIETEKILTPVANGDTVDIDSLTFTPEKEPVGDNVTTSLPNEPDFLENKPENNTSQTSKFDSALKNNEPSINTDNSKYFSAEKDAKIEKTDFESRLVRTDANFILNTLRNELPGTLNKSSLLALLKQEDSEINTGEMSAIIDQLVKKGKIKLVPKKEKSKDESEDTIPGKIEDEEEHSSSINPDDFVDRHTLGATRKGFNVDFDF